MRILATRIQERSGVRTSTEGDATCSVELEIKDGIGREGLFITGALPGRLRIVGNDELGLLYGVGKFLRMNSYREGSFTLGDWRGQSVPQKSFRGIYLATHFFNYYHEAPIADVQQYVEDLGLWGYNTIVVWFDMHHYDGIEDPAAQAMITRLSAILKAANSVGLKTGLTLIANEAYANSPVDLRADWTAGHDGYTKEIRGHYHVELCPNKPGAKVLTLQWREGVFKAFKSRSPDYVFIWPYDQGGCTSSKCAPWGTNGFLTLAPSIASLARRDFPRCKVVLSTWYFDKFTSGEWDGLERIFLQKKPSWVDYLMADDAGVNRYSTPASVHRVPGRLPLLSFPEISMWGALPWGGFGANPLPNHSQNIWNIGKDVLDGGMPYSEGIFEDVNKALYAQFFWQKDIPASNVLDEYISYEFSSKAVKPIHEAVSILEKNYPRHAEGLDNPNAPVRFVLDQTTGAEKAFDLLQQADEILSPRARSAWRWRILYLRALIDSELVKNQFQVSRKMEAALDELTKIYFAQKAIYSVAPPTKEAIEKYRTEGEGSSGLPGTARAKSTAQQ